MPTIINNKPMVIRIEVDCDPMIRRQEMIGKSIFYDILKQEYREPNNTFFGCWSWCGVKCNADQQARIKEFLTELYNDGVVRYVSWGEE